MYVVFDGKAMGQQRNKEDIFFCLLRFETPRKNNSPNN